MSDVLWRRLRYMLTPQWDIYNSIAPHLGGCDVLEIGCGTGIGTLQLAMYANTIIAVDIDDDAVKFAGAVLPNRKISWWRGDILDAARVPLGNKGAAVAIEVLEHIPEWEKALTNIRAALHPGGKLYISARNRNADLRRNDLHEREWTAAEFRAALAEFFPSVTLYDYTLEAEQGDDSRVTPLVAVAVK